MYILKKDLKKYKDMYKYNYKLLDVLIRYALTLIQENVKDNNDIDYVNKIILDVKKILILTDKLVINRENRFNVFFKENEKHTLINNSSEHSKKIKEYYDMLVNTLLNVK